MKKLLPLFFCFPLLLMAGAQSPMQYAPFMVKPPAVGGDTPFDIVTNYSGLRLYLNADYETLNDGDPVSTATDRSGNSFNFTASSTVRPTYKVDIVSGTNNAYAFDGSNDQLSRASFSLTNFIGYTSNTVMVALVLTNKSSQQLFGGGSSGSWTVFTPVSGSFYYDDPQTSARLNGTAPANFTNRWCVLELYRDGANSKIIYNGTQVATKSDCTGAVTDASQTIYIGSGGGGAYLLGSIGRIAVWNRALSDAERGAIRTNWFNLYGVSP